MIADTPRKATQKELARLMGVTENTISRHLN
jgi:predicted DNA binding protein